MLPFLDRKQEMARLRRVFDSGECSLVCVYGRRRLGKSRLLKEALEGRRAVFYVGDERDAPLQRASLSREVSTIVPGFADVSYDGWEPLLDRLWREVPPGTIVVLDEFPYLVNSSRELPSLIQKRMDGCRKAMTLAICGSSQRMMKGIVLDSTAPLFGRAREILRIGPLGAGWIREALGIADAALAVESFAVWGGVPRYWELASNYRDRRRAVDDLVLDPLGVLHREPDRILLDDIQELARAASILTLIGQGCNRISEIGARLGIAATSLSRPLARLLDLGLAVRDVPYGIPGKDSKRSFYRIADPFLGFWYRFVDPNRSRLAAGGAAQVSREIDASWPVFLGSAWEELARTSVAHLRLGRRSWSPAGRWWGRDESGRMMEIGIMAAASDDRETMLIGEAKLTVSSRDRGEILSVLRDKASRCPELRGRHVIFALFALRARGLRRGGASGGVNMVVAQDVLSALR